MSHIIMFDCEFLVTEGAYRRFWCGPYDPDPIVVQIGALKLDLAGNTSAVEELKLFISPIDRYGTPIEIPEFFTNLTSITAEQVGREGIPLKEALETLAAFADGAKLWSWGKDELNLLAISCFIAGITPTLPAHMFDNACKLMLKAGMPYEDIQKTRSGDLAAYFKLVEQKESRHDGLDDARSIAKVLQFLLDTGKLESPDFS